MNWFNKIDLNLLVSQKMTLLFVIDQMPLSEAQRNDLQGIVHLLDSLQDVCESQAAPVVLFDERKAFEKWATPNRFDVGHKGEDGSYLGGATSITWAAWQARAAIEKSAAKEPAVPQGWKLVPVEPTSEMLSAVGKEMSWCNPVGIFRKMLAATPAAPSQEPAHCTNSDTWNCKYCRKTEGCEAPNDPRNFAAPSQPAVPSRLLQKLDASIKWLESGEVLPGTSACIGLDDIKTIRATLAAAPSQERCCTCGYLTSEREHLGCLRKAVKDLDAATGGPYPSQPVNRPQNCGTSFCSCIECVCEPEPVTLTDSYAGVIAWIGDKQCKRVLTEGAIKHEHTPGVAMRNTAHQCVQEVIIAALREKEGK